MMMALGAGGAAFADHAGDRGGVTITAVDLVGHVDRRIGEYPSRYYAWD
jgi:hypothetical protein